MHGRLAVCTGAVRVLRGVHGDGGCTTSGPTSTVRVLVDPGPSAMIWRAGHGRDFFSTQSGFDPSTVVPVGVVPAAARGTARWSSQWR